MTPSQKNDVEQSRRASSNAEQLFYCAIRFANRVPMIAGPSKIRGGKRDPTVRTIPQDVPRRRLAIDAEEKPRLRIYVRVTPAI